MRRIKGVILLATLLLAGCAGWQPSRGGDERDVSIDTIPDAVRRFAQNAAYPAPHFSELEFLTLDDISERTRVYRVDSQQGLSTVRWCTDRKGQLDCGHAVDLGKRRNLVSYWCATGSGGRASTAVIWSLHPPCSETST